MPATPRKHTRAKHPKTHAEICKEYRENASAETKAKWSEERSERRKRQREREAEEAAQEVRDSNNQRQRRSYTNRVDQNSVVLPKTPQSKAAAIADIVESATPNTSGYLSTEHKIFKKRDRDAAEDIVNATSNVVKANKSFRKQLIGEFENCNKKAVSERLGINRSNFHSKPRKGRNPRIASTTIEDVVAFYYREEVTVTYPNKTKSGIVLRVMKYTRKRTFKMFLEEYPDAKIGKTTFDKMKPKDVRLMKHARWLQCICGVCDNVVMLCRSIKLSMQRSNLDVPLFLLDEYSLAKQTVCNINQFDCLDRKCDVCGPQLLRNSLGTWVSDNPNDSIKYMKWERVSEPLPGQDKEVVKLRKVEHTGQRWELYNELTSYCQKFPLHIYDAINQLSAFKKCKNTLKPGSAVCIVDFAENYVIKQWSEDQSCYYSRNSITVHPMVLIFDDTYRVKRDSVVMISEDLKHDHAAVQLFMKTLAGHMAIHYPDVTNLLVWSDGCGVQYKSRMPLYNLAKNFGTNLQITWNYFGSRHGKGESDGESAVVKNFLDNATKAQQLHKHDCADVFDFLIRSDRHIIDGKSQRHFYHVTSKEINSVRKDAPNIKDISAIPRVMQIHQAISSLGGLNYSRSSCYCEAGSSCSHSEEPQSFKYPGVYQFICYVIAL